MCTIIVLCPFWMFKMKSRRGGERAKLYSWIRNWEEQEWRDDDRRSREGEQRHVGFTITLLGCTVIKARSPRRGGRLQACPVSSPAPLISYVSPTERQRRNLQEGLPLLLSLRSVPHRLRRICKASTHRHRTGAHSAQTKEALPRMSRCLDPEQVSFFDVLMTILHTFLKALCWTFLNRWG